MGEKPVNYFHRVSEIQDLEEKCDSGNGSSKFILVEGNKHTGKTTLVSKFLESRGGICFKITQSPSHLQLREISSKLKQYVNGEDYIPELVSWDEFFTCLFQISKNKPIYAGLDEIHNLEQINPGVLTRLKKLWRRDAQHSQLNLIGVTLPVCRQEGRQLKSVSVLNDLFHGVVKVGELSFTEVCRYALSEDERADFIMLRNVYICFGGLPRIYHYLSQEKLWSRSFDSVLGSLMRMQFSPLAPVIETLTHSIPEKGNTVYNSVLQALAQEYATVSSIGHLIGIPATSVIKYLTILEKKKEIIRRIVPLSTPEPEKSRYGRYIFRNNFPPFWYRFKERSSGITDPAGYETGIAALIPEVEEYIRSRYARFACGLLLSGEADEFFAACRGAEDTEAGPVWNRFIYFETALYNRKRHEIKIIHFAGENDDFSTLVSHVKRIRDHYGMKKAELHVFIPEADQQELKFLIPYEELKIHTGFPDELIFNRSAKELQLVSD